MVFEGTEGFLTGEKLGIFAGLFDLLLFVSKAALASTEGLFEVEALTVGDFEVDFLFGDTDDFLETTGDFLAMMITTCSCF